MIKLKNKKTHNNTGETLFEINNQFSICEMIKYLSLQNNAHFKVYVIEVSGPQVY